MKLLFINSFIHPSICSGYLGNKWHMDCVGILLFLAKVHVPERRYGCGHCLLSIMLLVLRVELSGAVSLPYALNALQSANFTFIREKLSSSYLYFLTSLRGEYCPLSFCRWEYTIISVQRGDPGEFWAKPRCGKQGYVNADAYGFPPPPPTTPTTTTSIKIHAFLCIKHWYNVLVPNAACFPAIERVTASVYPCVSKFFISRKILFPYVQLLSAAYGCDCVGGVSVHVHWNNYVAVI
jgi:hypothetical protein